MSGESDRTKKLPADLVITRSINKDTHLCVLVVEPKNGEPFHLAHGRLEGVYLNKNTRELHGHVFLADDGSFSAEFERPLSQKYGRPADYERLAAVILSDVWRGCQLDGKMTRDKQAEILKYSNERALREALDRAKITSFLNTPKAKIIRQRLDHKKYLGYVAIADETDISIKSHVDLYEINVKGWVWFYGDSKAKKGALHVKLPSEKGGDENSEVCFHPDDK